MTKYLGIDLGTASIGWAVRETNETGNQIIAKGVRIFRAGMASEKGREYSRAAQRTSYRSTRKRYRRRKLRKTSLLKVLIEVGFCPLDMESLTKWAIFRKGVPYEYPIDHAPFQEWLKLNPYECRYKAINPDSGITPFEIGRALYHICQRRGFKSSRKDIKSDGLPKDLEYFNNFKEVHGKKLLIEHQYPIIQENLLKRKQIKEAVRNRSYKTNNEEEETKNVEKEIKPTRLLYAEELLAIFKAQQFSPSLQKKIYDLIIEQRPLKGQKGSVGYCTFEKRKKRTQQGTPVFEEFRMYQKLNDIRYTINEENVRHPLTKEQKDDLIKNVFQKNKRQSFKFSEITKRLNKDSRRTGIFYTLNFDEDTSVSGCPTIGNLKDLIQKDWENIKIKYTSKKGEQLSFNSDDIWHLWNTLEFEQLKSIAIQQIGLDKDKATKFASVRVNDGYANLSTKAIKKIIFFLKQGFIYSHAVFLANMEEVVGKENWSLKKDRLIQIVQHCVDTHNLHAAQINAINALIKELRLHQETKEDVVRTIDNDYQLDDEEKTKLFESLQKNINTKQWEGLSNDAKNKVFIAAEQLLYKKCIETGRLVYLTKKTLKERIVEELINGFPDIKFKFSKLYHPSDIETFKPWIRLDKYKKIKLQSPRIPSIKNPMATKALFELKKLLEDLLNTEQTNEYLIDKDTVVIVELMRELNDANKRAAIQRRQRKENRENENAKEAIKEIFENHYKDYGEPSEDDILKYRLWKEQNEICIYTGVRIGCADLFNGNKYDLEHTLPRSRSFDNSKENLTIADAQFNRNTKKAQTPYELMQKQLLNEDEIKNLLEHWLDNARRAKYAYQKNKRPNGLEDKTTKDRRIQNKHFFQMEWRYWKEKYDRFFLNEIKQGFVNSQRVDTGIITKYARQYLSSFFEKVHTVKGTLTAVYRKEWGLQDANSKKSRDTHYHHATDAAVLTCMTLNAYNKLSEVWRQEELERKRSATQSVRLYKPWKTFTQDINAFSDEILVSHGFTDNTFKQTRKKLRVNGKIQRDKNGDIIYQEGLTLRGQLHKDTFYGLIFKDNEKKYVVRKKIHDLKSSDINKIVDPAIRDAVKHAGLGHIQKQEGKVKLEVGEKKRTIEIGKVRTFASVSNPLQIKKHSHQRVGSSLPQHHYYYAQNSEVYAAILYQNEKKRKIITIRLFDLIKQNQKFETLEDTFNSLSDLPFYGTVQKGMKLIIYENEPNEINWTNIKDLSKRLYYVSGIESDGRLTLIHHSESRKMEDVNAQKVIANGKLKKIDKGITILSIDAVFPKLRLSKKNYKFLIEEIDFTISPSGIIRNNKI